MSQVFKARLPFRPRSRDWLTRKLSLARNASSERPSWTWNLLKKMEYLEGLFKVSQSKTESIENWLAQYGYGEQTLMAPLSEKTDKRNAKTSRIKADPGIQNHIPSDVEEVSEEDIEI